MVVPELVILGITTCHVQGICVAMQKLVVRYLRRVAFCGNMQQYAAMCSILLENKFCSRIRGIRYCETQKMQYFFASRGKNKFMHAFDYSYLNFLGIPSSRLLIKNGTSVKNRVPSLICFIVFICRTRLQ